MYVCTEREKGTFYTHTLHNLTPNAGVWQQSLSLLHNRERKNGRLCPRHVWFPRTHNDRKFPKIRDSLRWGKEKKKISFRTD